MPADRRCLADAIHVPSRPPDFRAYVAFSGLVALPYFDSVDIEEIDLLLVTHFHLDHVAALPYFLFRTGFRGRVFMTHSTKAIYRLMLADFARVGKAATEEQIFTEQELQRSMDKIEVIDYHQEVEVAGIRFWCYAAGHVLGAAMFMIDIAGVRFLYTGDYNREEDRHLRGAEMPSVPPDIICVESTYGVQTHLPRFEREKLFTETIAAALQGGGRVLCPVFALGRTQELLLLLEEFWAAHPELHCFPIYYASPLAKRCMSVYQTYVNQMNKQIQAKVARGNPFVFKHIENLKGLSDFERLDSGPCVVFASPGMLQSGFSRQLFDRWCQNPKNACVIPGYCPEGTLAKHILTEPKEVQLLSGQVVPLRMSVQYISFSAHADYTQTSEFLSTLNPQKIILVHGESNEMLRMKSALVSGVLKPPDPIRFHPIPCHAMPFGQSSATATALCSRGHPLTRLLCAFPSFPLSLSLCLSPLSLSVFPRLSLSPTYVRACVRACILIDRCVYFLLPLSATQVRERRQGDRAFQPKELPNRSDDLQGRQEGAGCGVDRREGRQGGGASGERASRAKGP